MLQLPFSMCHAGSHLIVPHVCLPNHFRKHAEELGAELGFVPPGAGSLCGETSPPRGQKRRAQLAVWYGKQPTVELLQRSPSQECSTFTLFSALCSLKRAWSGLGTAVCAQCCLSPLLLAGPWGSWRRSWNPSESGGKSWRASWMAAAPRSAASGRAGGEPAALLLCLRLVGRTAALLLGRLFSLRLWGGTQVNTLTAFSLARWSKQQPLLHPDLRGYQFLCPWQRIWILCI